MKLRLHAHNKAAAFCEDFILAAQYFAKNLGMEVEVVRGLPEADIVVVDNEAAIVEVAKEDVVVAVVNCHATQLHPRNVFFTDDVGKIKRLVRHMKRRLGKINQAHATP